MKNKFEALTAFQSWPEDWQRLCAEYWAETELKADAAKLPSIGDTAKEKNKREKWTVEQQEYLVQCVDRTTKRTDAAKRFLKKFPGRTVAGVITQIGEMKRADGIMEVKY